VETRTKAKRARLGESLSELPPKQEEGKRGCSFKPETGANVSYLGVNRAECRKKKKPKGEKKKANPGACLI